MASGPSPTVNLQFHVANGPSSIVNLQFDVVSGPSSIVNLQCSRYRTLSFVDRSSLFKMSTGITRYFSSQLPTAKETAIGPVATREANQGVKRVLEKQQSQQKTKKRKEHSHYSHYSDGDRADIGK